MSELLAEVKGTNEEIRMKSILLRQQIADGKKDGETELSKLEFEGQCADTTIEFLEDAFAKISKMR